MKQGIGAVLVLAVILSGCVRQTDAFDGSGAEASRISMCPYKIRSHGDEWVSGQ